MNITLNNTYTNSSSSDNLLQMFSVGIATFSVNLILGLPTNCYVVWLIVTGARGTMASEFFALNLAVTELLYCFSNVLYLHSIISYFSSPVCQNGICLKIEYFVGGFLFFSRPLFQSCVCVERYLAVVHPVVFLRYKPLRYRVACCTVVWLLVLGSCFAFAETGVFLEYYDYLFGFYILIFLVMLFCCISVLSALKQSGPGEGKRERGREGGNSVKRKAFNIILIIMMTIFLNYLSFVVVIPLRVYLSNEGFMLAFNVCVSTAIIAGFIQPLLYLHRAGKLPCIKSL